MRIALLAALLLGSASVGCSNPCDKLLDRMCSCPGELAKKACAEAKERNRVREKEALDKDKCRQALESFRCDSYK